MPIVTRIIDKESCIFYQMPAGKPDPTGPYVEEENRKLVTQSALKGASCWYYLFNLMRIRIGKNLGKDPSEELLNAREIERVCSWRRKEITKYEDTAPIPIEVLYGDSNSQEVKYLQSIKLKEEKMSEEECKNFQEECKNFQDDFRQFEKKDRLSLYSIFQEKFMKQKKCQNLHDFLINERYSKVIEVSEKFLNTLNVDLEKSIPPKQKSKLNNEQHAMILDSYVRDYSAIYYGLGKSSWKPKTGTPQEAANRLLIELKTNGPLMVLGNVGVPSYVNKPQKLNSQLKGKDICGKDIFENIYGWEQGAKLSSASGAGHTVLIIGAEVITSEKQYVYFIDPVDSSDNRKIYKASFENFRKKLGTSDGLASDDPRYDYAYTGRFKLLTGINSSGGKTIIPLGSSEKSTSLS